MAKVTEIWTYPIKSCKPIKLNQARLWPTGGSPHFLDNDARSIKTCVGSRILWTSAVLLLGRLWPVALNANYQGFGCCLDLLQACSSIEHGWWLQRKGSFYLRWVHRCPPIAATDHRAIVTAGLCRAAEFGARALWWCSTKDRRFAVVSFRKMIVRFVAASGVPRKFLMFRLFARQLVSVAEHLYGEMPRTEPGLAFVTSDIPDAAFECDSLDSIPPGVHLKLCHPSMLTVNGRHENFSALALSATHSRSCTVNCETCTRAGLVITISAPGMDAPLKVSLVGNATKPSPPVHVAGY
eukprot:2530950-Pyramimonas_sp.AAC.1